MAGDSVFFDVLPRFDWALADSGVKKLVGMFDGAAKDIAGAFGGDLGGAAARTTDQIAADVRRMQGEVERSTNAISSSYGRMIEAQGRAEVGARRYAEAVAAAGAESSRAAAAYTSWATATVKATDATDAHTRALAAQEAMQAKLTTTQAEHQAALDASTSKLAAWGAVANRVGVVSAVGFGAALGVATKAAGDFESSQTRLVTTAGESRDQLDAVNQGLLKMAGQVGESTEALSKGMYIVESAGFHGADGLKVMQAAAQGAKEENADLTETANAVTTALHDYHLGADQAATITSKMITAVSQGKTTMGAFAEGLHSVQPLAAAAHISIDDLYASLAQMTASGMSADQATQNMADAIRHLQSPTAAMDKELAQIGIDSRDLSQHLGERGLAGSMMMIQEAVLQHMGPSGKVLLDTFNESKQNADAASEAYTHLQGRTQALAEGVLNGTVTLGDYRKQLKSLPLDQATVANQWANLYEKANGFNGILKAGGSDVQTYTSALAKATGDASSLNVMLQLTGENAGKTKEDIAAIAKTTANADGSVKDWEITQGTFNQKLDEAKSGFHAMVVELGLSFLPVMTDVMDDFAKLGGYLSEHKGLAEGLVITLGGLALAWAAVRTAMLMQDAWDLLRAGYTFITETAIPRLGLLASAWQGVGVAETAAGTEGTAALSGISAGAAEASTAVAGIGTAATVALGPLSALAATLFMVNQGNKAPAFGGTPGDPNVHDDYTVDQAQTAFHLPDGVPAPGSTEAEEAISAAAVGGDAGAKWVASAHSKGDQAMRYAWLMSHGGLGVQNFAAPSIYDHDMTFPSADAVRAHQEGRSGLPDGLTAAPPAPEVPSAPPIGSAPTYDPNNPPEAGDEGKNGKKKPAGSREDPIYMAEIPGTGGKSGTSGSMSGMGPTGTSILTGQFEFTPQGIAKYFTTLLADLALGNPIGKQLASQQRGDSPRNPVYVVDANGNVMTKDSYDRYKRQFAIDQDQSALQDAISAYGPDSNEAKAAQKKLTSDQQRQAADAVAQQYSGYGSAASNLVGYHAPGVNSTADQYAAATIAQAKAAGLNEEQTLAALSTEILESGMGTSALSRQMQNQSGTVVTGPFQQDSSYNKYGNRLDPNDAAHGFIDQFVTRGLGLNNPDPYAQAVKVQVGTYGPDYVRSFRNQALSYYNRLAPSASGPAATSSTGDGAPSQLTGSGSVTAMPPATTSDDLTGLMGGGGEAPLFRRPPGFTGVTMPPVGMPLQGSMPGKQFGEGQKSGGGFSTSIGSTIASIAGPALDAFAPGSSMVAQQGAKLLDRTIGYLGQLGGIGAEFGLETFLPGGMDNPLANPSKSWLGKFALGFAGAHSDSSNSAGMALGSPTDPTAKQDPSKPAAAAQPSASPNPNAGGNQQPGIGGAVNNGVHIENMEVHNHGDASDGTAVARDINRYQMGMSR